MDIAIAVSLALALCLVCGVCPVNAYYEHTCFLDDRQPSPGGLCGPRASDMVDMVCRGSYGRKRSVRFLNDDPSLEPVKFASPKREALSYLGKRTSEQGFVCECCYNRCSFTELREYCHD
ncbi:con-Ins Im1-like isoform X2 [Haliotis rubra]|nr:con-Ins Im1-like isoform X2 [Haliotis rubra]XP_046562405.1 con-Ins Im1-like isoform X2 [Haliotis rubra]XP_046562406.1 con-Ins Im1-like isoform X2 [Haliotis rubra]XP_046562407.1 con-Ins Im1-like isoform X2 [Haliotis rubra]XP_046562408.1 con-Ins Im1-like isoform X2 [Haliotis rubra]